MPDPMDYQREREKWRNFPRVRPPGIVAPGPGQESVWTIRDPRGSRPSPGGSGSRSRGSCSPTRPPRCGCARCSSRQGYYVPRGDIRMEHLEPSTRTSFCEWKGLASYWSVRVGNRFVKDSAWRDPEPDPGYEAITDYVAFYPRRMDACWVGDDRVTPQPGLYYGGWVTPDSPGRSRGCRARRPGRRAAQRSGVRLYLVPQCLELCGQFPHRAPRWW